MFRIVDSGNCPVARRTAAKYQSELGMMASEDLRRQWVDMRTQELQRKELSRRETPGGCTMNFVIIVNQFE